MAKEATVEIWIGLAHVAAGARTSFLSEYEGAYVNALALSRNREEFLSQVTSALEEDLEVVLAGVDDIEPLRVRSLRGEVDLEIRKVVDTLTPDHPVDFDDFQFYVD